MQAKLSQMDILPSKNQVLYKINHCYNLLLLLRMLNDEYRVSSLRTLAMHTNLILQYKPTGSILQDFSDKTF